jgi:hypothetical protein
MLQEYLESGDMEEAARCIGELRLPQYDYYIVKRSITLAMDRKDREREAISVLLSTLYGQCISPQQMQKVCSLICHVVAPVVPSAAGNLGKTLQGASTPWICEPSDDHITTSLDH